jgi:hypothetical protein
MNRGSNAISGCQENCETLCSFSLPLMLSHEHNLNVPQFSWQPLATFGSTFDFPHRLNILDHLHSPQHESETAISEAASMLLVTSISSALSRQF